MAGYILIFNLVIFLLFLAFTVKVNIFVRLNIS